MHSHLENYFVLFLQKKLVRPIQFYKLINNLKKSMLNRESFLGGGFQVETFNKNRGLYGELPTIFSLDEFHS